MKDSKVQLKAFNIRVEKELWVYMKRLAIEQETSLNQIVNRCLVKLKNNRENNIDIT